MANKINSSRNMMFNSHLEQAVVLKEPDFPRVFTNYENEVGRYSSSYKQIKGQLKVVAKISKFSSNPDVNYILVVKDQNNRYDVIERKIGEKLTEGYCYINKNEVIDSKKKGDAIRDGEVLFRSTSFDEDMNYRYGINAKALYLIENNTIEDAIICSESFAKRMTSHYMNEVEVNINNNDILCNLYANGDEEEYKAFPDIGEETNGEVLVSRRRINYEHALYDLQNENLKNINYNIDTTFHSRGKLIDIDIYCNQDIDKIEKYFYNSQIVKYLKMQNEFYTSLTNVLGPLVNNPKIKCSEDLTYLYRRAKDILDPEVKWKNEKSDFDNIVIVFRILEENQLHKGSKITGKYGNKGVISKIVPDDEMPVSEHGDKVEVIFNALGVVNRLNPAQLYELELNFISDNIVRKMKTLPFKEKLSTLFDYIKEINPAQYKSMVKHFNSLDKKEKVKFIKDTEEKGIFLHQPPFWGNVSFDRLSEIYDIYDWIEPYTCYINGKEIKNKLIIGDSYVLKMKHEPKGKFSARSTSYINMKGTPSKSLNYKKSQILYSTTPIRLGEMEIDNLLLTQNPDEVVRMASMYSSSEENRHELIEQLLTEDILDLEEVELDNPSDNHNREILDVYFKALGLQLTKTTEESE